MRPISRSSAESGDGAGGPDRHRARGDREHARAEREVAQVIDALRTGALKAAA